MPHLQPCLNYGLPQKDEVFWPANQSSDRLLRNSKNSYRPVPFTRTKYCRRQREKREIREVAKKSCIPFISVRNVMDRARILFYDDNMKLISITKVRVAFFNTRVFFRNRNYNVVAVKSDRL